MGLYGRVLREYPNTEAAHQAKWWLASCHGNWASFHCCAHNQGKQDWERAAAAYMALYGSATDPGSKCDALRRYAEVVFHGQGKWREGLGIYRRLLREFPENPDPSPYRTNRTCGWQPFRGTELIDYNVMLASGPLGATAHAGLMWYANTAEEAIRLHEEFVRLAPKLDTIRYHGLFHLEQKLRYLGEQEKADQAREEIGLCNKWLVIGPFYAGNDTAETAFEVELDVLKGEPDMSKSYGASTKDGRKGTAMWARGGSVIGSELFEAHPQYRNVTAVGTFYALTNILSQEAQHAQLRVGASGQVRIWISNEAIPTGEIISVPSTLIDRNIWPINLAEGENQLFMRFDLLDDYATNENYVRITSNGGRALRSIAYSVPEVPADNRMRSTFMQRPAEEAALKTIAKNAAIKGEQDMKNLEGAKWFVDETAVSNGEPGIYHSYIAGLASVLKLKQGHADPVWLMGSSAMAFRIWVSEVMCPSAMSVFDWMGILPDSVQQAGYEVTYISRLWHEEHIKDERRLDAQERIIEAIDDGTPAIVWDIGVPEWGLIIGYDNNRREFKTLSCESEVSTMPYAQLGDRDIKVLSVTVVGNRNKRSERDIINNSLRRAVAHWDKKEWMDRPKYEDAADAFDMWANCVHPENENEIDWDFTKYYADHYYSARCYARDYLRRIAGDSDLLEKASKCYSKVASELKPVWEAFSKDKKPKSETLVVLSKQILKAKEAEAEGISYVRAYVEKQTE